MSIYKDPVNFWLLTAQAAPARRIEMVADMIEYHLTAMPESRLTIHTLCGLLEVDTTAKELLIKQAVELLKQQDRVRHRPSTKTIQYRPQEERRLVTDLLINGD